MQWSTAASIECHDGLSLVGDADGGNRSIELSAHGLQRGTHRLPDFFCVVFDPAGLRVVLRELAVVGN
jgi:hypothetical protein